MPIHHSVLTARPAEGGKIKLGKLSEQVTQKQKGDGSYRRPECLNHFRITKTVRKGKDDNFVEDDVLMAMMPKDGDGQIRQIPILLDSDIIEEVFPTTLACYAGRSLHCKGSGSGTATRWEIAGGRQTGRTKQVPCTCSYLTDPQSTLKCKPHGTLWCTIVAGEETRLGVRHAFRTTSWNSIRAIQSGLETIRNAVGTICGIPMLLVVSPTLSRSREGATRTIQVVHVELRTKDLLALQRHAIETARGRHAVAQFAGRPVTLSLPAPAGPHETPEEQAAVQQEWHPDEVPDDDGEQGDEDEEPQAGRDFDAATGEVFDTTATEKTTMKPTATGPVPASSLAAGASGYTSEPKPGAERLKPAGAPSPVAASLLAKDTETITVGFDDVLPKDDPLRARIAAELTNLAELRGFGKADMATSRKEILAEVTLIECGNVVPFGQLKLGQGMKVADALTRMIKAKQQAELGDMVEESLDDDAIPE